MNEPVPSVGKTLQKLYLTLFLRGRSSRGLKIDQAPKSIARKLFGTLLLYGLVGLIALTFRNQPSFLLSFYLHGMSLLFLGMFVAASAGEILFNKDEAEILLHRPVEARTLLWAKISVLVRVSLWLACSFNLAGMLMGSLQAGGTWLFLPVHFVSTCLSALFCAGSVVLIYQVCLRWFGRERLDNIMTTAQVLLAVGMVVGGQLVQFVLPALGSLSNPAGKWWLFLMPPAWFAGFDEVFTGRAEVSSFIHAAVAIAMTSCVLMLALRVMARTYEEGLQTLAESQPGKPRDPGKRRLLERLIDAPPLSWLLRDPITKASFRLTAAYHFRDRDKKLRLYPGLAPVVVMPVVFLAQGMAGRSGSEIGIAFAGGYLGLVPLMAMNLLQFSQSWQASDIFRLAPTAGPAPFIHGATRAICTLIVTPGLILLAVIICLFVKKPEHVLMLLPGLIALPVYAMIPGSIEKTIPLSKPTEEAKSATRGAMMFVLMISALALPGIGMAAKQFGWFWPFLGLEAFFSIVACLALNMMISRARWDPLE